MASRTGLRPNKIHGLASKRSRHYLEEEPYDPRDQLNMRFINVEIDGYDIHISVDMDESEREIQKRIKRYQSMVVKFVTRNL